MKSPFKDSVSKLFTFLPALIIIAGVLFVYSEDSSQAEPIGHGELNLSTFVWDPISELSEQELTDLINKATRHQFKTIYVSIDEFAETDYKNVPDGSIDKIDLFITNANSAGISIYALAGDPNWHKSSHWYIPEGLSEFVNDYNKSHENNFDGLLLDIEPYAKQSFKIYDSQSWAEYEILVERLSDKVDQNIDLGFALPFWLDSSAEVDIFGSVAQKLNSRQRSFIFLMSYRPKATGNNGTISIAKKEFEYLKENQISTKIIIGQETDETQENNVSFYRLGKEALFSEIIKVHKHYYSHANYGGIGIHHLGSFLNL